MKEQEKVDLTAFEKAFSLNSSGCMETCKCGKTFYNANGGWDWEDGELEQLEADKTATNLAYGVGRIEMEGHIYVIDCDCWHERAIKIIRWLDSHVYQIGDYFREQKKQRIAEADKIPVDITFPFPEGFRSMVTAPKNATIIQVLMENGLTNEAHWAQDLSGEEQPPFRGWFVKNGNLGYHQIDEPIAWKPLDK